jgi:hypothetical protein
MFYAGDSDCVFGWLLEENSVVAAAKTEATLRRLELLHISVAGTEIAADTVKDIESGLAIYCAEVSAGFRRPKDRQ